MTERYLITLSDGTSFEHETHFEVVAGALRLYDKLDAVERIIAPGYWSSVERVA